MHGVLAACARFWCGRIDQQLCSYVQLSKVIDASARPWCRGWTPQAWNREHAPSSTFDFLNFFYLTFGSVHLGAIITNSFFLFSEVIHASCSPTSFQHMGSISI